MPIYRALNKLSNRVERGALTRLDWLTPEQIGKLEHVGAISRVGAPPLSELPGWSIRAGKLAKIGILDVEQFLEADQATLCKPLHVKRETLARYGQELETWLVIQPSEE